MALGRGPFGIPRIPGAGGRATNISEADPQDTAATAAPGTTGEVSDAGHVHQLHAHDHTGDPGDGGTLAHSALTGLTSGDPHTQYALESSLADVATSGDYNDLINTPTIPADHGLVIAVTGEGPPPEPLYTGDGTDYIYLPVEI